MEKKKLIKFLNLIPDDIRCNVHGEYNGNGGECIVDVWCGKRLIRGWESKIDNGQSIDDVISSYSCDNWKCVSDDYDYDMVKSALFDSHINEARVALTIDWNTKLRNKIENYIDNKPTEKQVKLAKAINHVLNLGKYFHKNMTKTDYDEFINSNIVKYREWLIGNSPEVLGM